MKKVWKPEPVLFIDTPLLMETGKRIKIILSLIFNVEKKSTVYTYYTCNYIDIIIINVLIFYHTKIMIARV